MDWNRFDPRGTDRDAAFEAFAGQLFERWCRRAHGAGPCDVRFVRGEGGDGGVEAYAILGSGDEIGLQAKWFRKDFGKKQIEQIDGSFRAAVANHPRLQCYLVALPRRLTDTRAAGATTAKKRPETTDRARWQAWKSTRAVAIAPAVEIVLWDEAALEAELSVQDNAGLDAHWFPGSTIPAEDLKRRFEAARAGWLRPRYFPDLHAEGHLERDIDLRLGEPEARETLRHEVRAAVEELGTVRDDVARLVRYAEFVKKVDEPQARSRAAISALEKLIGAGDTLGEALRSGCPLREPIAFGVGDENALRDLENALRWLDERHGPIREIREQMHRVLWEHNTPLTILHAWKRWQRAPNLVAFVGPPGIGKTHGLAHVVERQLFAREQPALLIRARDCPLDGGWEEILRRALDVPGQPLPALLNALEAAAVRAEVWRARASSGTGEVAPGPSSFLIAIDGLEESSDHQRWAELLGELSTHLARHPRLRAAVTLRIASMEPILGWMKPDARDVVRLSTDGGEVQELLGRYCARDRVPLPDRRLRWAIRDPLSVRLYCDLGREGRSWRRSDLSLPALLRLKIERAEEAVRAKVGGYGEHDRPLYQALAMIAERVLQRGELLRRDAIDALSATQRPCGLLSPAQWSQLLDEAAEHGLILLRESEPEDRSLRERTAYVEPAYDPLADYLLAETASRDLAGALDRKASPELSDVLQARPGALEQAVILLADCGVDIVAQGGLFRCLPSEHREELQLGAIAALENEAARRYERWVRERLVASMPSCRRVLAYLCAPVSRDADHPFGPRFVHETLLPFLPAKRDLFWSGPRSLPGDGGRPWQGVGPEALEALALTPEDRAEGPPLLLAWALTSVDTRWRRRLRAELARWGANDLDELLRWLDRVMATNDPQMAEDVCMIAFGAACLAGNDPRLEALAAWADENLLAPGARHRRQDVVVIHAARGIVERARVMGVGVTPGAIEHVKSLYYGEPSAPPIELGAVGNAAQLYGESPIYGDFGWEIASDATCTTADRSDDHGPGGHNTTVGGKRLTLKQFAFGALAAHVHAVGWSEREFVGNGPLRASNDALGMDWAIRLSRKDPMRYDPRSTQMVSEKYLLTGCRMVQAYSRVDPAHSPNLLPNPASDIDPRHISAWSPRLAEAITPAMPLTEIEQHLRAAEWVRDAPVPDLASFTRVPSASGPIRGADDWIVLRCFVIGRERDSQADSALRMSCFLVPQTHAEHLGLDRVEYRKTHPHAQDGLHDFREGVLGPTYRDPFEAVWAPWVTGEGGTEQISRRGSGESYDAVAASAGLTWEAEDGERELWLPAHWMRQSLGIVDADRLRHFTRREPGDRWHDEWHFRDRAGEVHAVYVHSVRGPDQEQALIVKRSSLRRALRGSRMCLAWEGWLYRALNIWLRPGPQEREPWDVERDWTWVAVGEAPTITQLPGWGDRRHYDEPPTPEPAPEPPPAVRVGPTNPDYGTKLQTTLGDDEVPYFLWDDPMTVAELRHYLATASPPERDRMLGKILREARDPDVWRFTTPSEVAARFDALSKHLGRRRDFWKFLLGSWEKEGLLVRKSA